VEGKEEGVIGKMAVGSVNRPVLMCRELGSVEFVNIRAQEKKLWTGMDWHGLPCPALPWAGLPVA
jgi:hypothetical protein